MYRIEDDGSARSATVMLLCTNTGVVATKHWMPRRVISRSHVRSECFLTTTVESSVYPFRLAEPGCGQEPGSVLPPRAQAGLRSSYCHASIPLVSSLITGFMWERTAHDQSVDEAAWLSGILGILRSFFGLVGFSACPSDGLLIGGVVVVEVGCERQVSLCFQGTMREWRCRVDGRKDTGGLNVCRG